MLVIALLLSCGVLYLDSLAKGEPFVMIHAPEGIKLFINAILNPPSFNEWQSLNSITDMTVTGVAFLFRIVAICTLSIAALSILALVAILIVQEIKSAWVRRKNG